MTDKHELVRPAFFAGQLLTDQDLQLEQQYFMDRLRRHHRFLHGWGVVHGLRVSVADSSTVVVSPGVAIDCEGNDLVCETPQKISISQIASGLFVALRYCEHHLRTVPTPGEEERPSRVCESVLLELLTSDPNSNHRGMGPGTPGCGTAHSVCIAALARRGTRWRVIAQLGRSKRRR